MGNAEAVSPEVEWHYESNGVRTGPVREADILGLIAANRLGRGSYVWSRGMTDWMTLETTSFAGQFSATPPPLTGAAVSNALVWWLAFGPLLGVFAAGFLSGLTDKDISSFWWTTLIINIALSIADEKKLKQAGHDTDSMGAAFIVPVYLFKRAKVLKQNNSYFIVWIVLFVLSLFADA
ncbi:DUF4339 domain-containing protein [Massilia sp. Dwa41.01b]|uniref:DUF4339 domain-containing protein n=1 Tax=unclassified Massilia TaxID=2609279 RepID=UPI0016016050|nr:MULTISPECIES: DUF4339 domain-containing protein [unclassified Massilia]QNA90304.1 DUF4339 domain-containing protein [Massilia sp. Dwa41.01b]QNB01204.1 DUF4339 domain-containing protein [Massilia sp. Se16.2.3]